MKKDKNILALFLRDIAFYAAVIVIASGSVIGILFGASLITELLSGIVSIEAGLVTIFTIAGVTLYIDFRPEKKKPRGKTGSGRTGSGKTGSGRTRLKRDGLHSLIKTARGQTAMCLSPGGYSVIEQVLVTVPLSGLLYRWE